MPPPSAQASITLNVIHPRPATPADTDAVRHVDAIANRVFLDPIRHGEYPADLLADTQHITNWSFVHDGDLQTIAAPIDTLGVNYYRPSLVAAASADAPLWPGTDLAHELHEDGPRTAMDWVVV